MAAISNHVNIMTHTSAVVIRLLFLCQVLIGNKWHTHTQIIKLGPCWVGGWVGRGGGGSRFEGLKNKVNLSQKCIKSEPILCFTYLIPSTFSVDYIVNTNFT